MFATGFKRIALAEGLVHDEVKAAMSLALSEKYLLNVERARRLKVVMCHVQNTDRFLCLIIVIGSSKSNQVILSSALNDGVPIWSHEALTYLGLIDQMMSRSRS